MANPFAGMENTPMPGPMNNFMQTLRVMNPKYIKQQFNQFCNNLTGDPKQIVMQMVSSGQMSQQQLNYLQQVAPQVQQIINGEM